MSAPVYQVIFRSVFARMDPEQAHRVVMSGLRTVHRLGTGPVLEYLTRPAPQLKTQALGISFPSPFGLAAGFDKGATAALPLGSLGFGHIEIGTVTGQAQPGNDKPRLFRLVTDRALINRMGFNNAGAAQVRTRLQRTRAQIDKRRAAGRHVPVIGVNIGKTKMVPLEGAVQDYLVSTRELAPLADYLVVNVSSPNTPGLRQLQEIDSLRPLLRAVGEEADAAAQRHVPLLVKIAPDLADEDIDAVAELVSELKLDGIIAVNTTVSRQNLRTAADQVEQAGAGGLSGPVLAGRAKEILVRLRAALSPGVVVISVGGVTSAADVAERLDLGADLVQGYTAFVYAGPFWARRINRGLMKNR